MRYAILLVSLLAFGCGGRNAADANARGKAALRSGDTRGAIRAFSEAVKEDPNTSKYRFNLGLALARARVYDQSAASLREAIRLDATNMDARRLLARVDDEIASDRASLVAQEIRNY